MQHYSLTRIPSKLPCDALLLRKQHESKFLQSGKSHSKNPIHSTDVVLSLPPDTQHPPRMHPKKVAYISQAPGGKESAEKIGMTCWATTVEKANSTMSRIGSIHEFASETQAGTSLAMVKCCCAGGR